MTADRSPAQLRGNHDPNSNDDDDDGRGSGGGGNNTAGGAGGRNDCALCETFDPQRSSGAGSRLPTDRKAGRQSFNVDG